MARNASSVGEKFRAGVWESIIAAIYGFIPALIINLGLLGLAALVPHLDYIFIPMLAICLGLALYGWAKKETSNEEA
jgi:membrane transport protein MerF